MQTVARALSHLGLDWRGHRPASAVVFLATFHLYVTIDAYRSAKAWNLQHDAPRRPRWQRSLHIAASLLLLLLLNPTELVAHYVSLHMVNNVAG